LYRTGADCSLAVSGIAGPGGATQGKPVGTVWFALALRHGQSIETVARVKFFKGDREAVRRKAVQFALQLILGAEFPGPIQ
jgi:nicotinamide-nucleotide amidase